MRQGANPEDLRIIKRCVGEGMKPEELSHELNLELSVVESLAAYFGYSPKKKEKTNK